MTHEMYKIDRQMTPEAAVEACNHGTHGTLSVNGDDGYPYAVPVNYIYYNDKIYIHSAKYGYKVDCLKRDNKACFSAIINSRIEGSHVTAAFRSIVATGKVRMVEDDGEKREVLEQFIYKLIPDHVEVGLKFVDAAFEKTLLLCFEIEEMKGKENMGNTFDV